MPKFPGMMNGYTQQKPRQVQVSYPWPPGQIATSNHEMRCRSDVETVLKDMRRELTTAGLSLGDFVWALRRNPANLLMFYIFHADCVPSVAVPVGLGPFREPWVWRYVSEDPPSAEQWEVKFRILGSQPVADVAKTEADEERRAGSIQEQDCPGCGGPHEAHRHVEMWHQA